VIHWKNPLPRADVSERRTLAHDLNNDLTIIVGECDLLAEMLTDEAARARMTKIRSVAMRMAERIENRACPELTLHPLGREGLPSRPCGSAQDQTHPQDAIGA
jgi:hypothetical protein